MLYRFCIKLDPSCNCNKMPFLFISQITNIGGIIHETSVNNFQILAGSASFLMPYLSLGLPKYFS